MQARVFGKSELAQNLESICQGPIFFGNLNIKSNCNIQNNSYQ